MLWHKHHWKVTGVHQLCEVNFYMRDIRKPVTEVLLVCDCGTARTECLVGHWTLEQLQPQPALPETDKEFFKKLGVKL